MITNEMTEQFITNRIENDLRKKDELIKDPLGYSIYLFFLLKNGIRSPEVDNLVDWMNSWVENIINQGKFSKFVDKELTSAVFAYYSLKRFKRLRTKVQSENLQQLLTSHVKAHCFFDNFTLSLMILLAVSDTKNVIESYFNVLEWVKREVGRETVFNDAKNLVLACILFEKLSFEHYLRKVIEYCWRRLTDNNIPYYDEIFYAWVLWTFRNLKEEKELPQIREFTHTSIRNASGLLKEEPVDESVKQYYGLDTRAEYSGFNLSKISLAVYLDILHDFMQITLRVTKEELSRKDIPPWVRLSPLLSAILLFSDGAVLWVSFQWNIVKRISLADMTWHSFRLAIPQYLINFIIFLTVISLGVVSISFLWDIGYKGYIDPKLIKGNLRQRLKSRVMEGIVIALILAILAGLFGM